MLVRHKEVPYWWYILILIVAFVFGIIVTTTQNITMPVWSYIIALLTGAFVAPFVSSLQSQIGQLTLILVNHSIFEVWLR
jgi:hypothetical protein